MNQNKLKTKIKKIKKRIKGSKIDTFEKRGKINMNIELKRVTINDIDEIIKMQKESFKPLLERYNDGDLNPYNESFEKVKYKIENYYYYFIVIDGKKARV